MKWATIMSEWTLTTAVRGWGPQAWMPRDHRPEDQCPVPDLLFHPDQGVWAQMIVHYFDFLFPTIFQRIIFINKSCSLHFPS